MKKLIQLIKFKFSMVGFRYRLWQCERCMVKYSKQLEKSDKNVSRETQNESTNLQNPAPRKMGNRPRH